MARYFVTHQTLSLDCGIVTINMRTASAIHLWLLYTTIRPNVGITPDFQQPAERPHHLNFQLFIEGDVEQEEPGETKTHTFKLKWPANAETLWFYTINVGTNKIKASRSPIFAYQFVGTYFWRETWGIFPDNINGFTYQYDNTLPPPTSGLNNLTMFVFSHPGGLAPGQHALLGNSFSAVMPAFESCGMNFTFTVPAYPAQAGWGGALIALTIRRVDGIGFPVTIYFKTGGPTSVPTDSPPPTNQFPVELSPGEHTVSLQELIAFRHAAYPTSIAPGLVEITFIDVSSGNHHTQYPFGQTVPFGTLTLKSVDSTPIDVSKQWRKLRLSPKLA